MNGISAKRLLIIIFFQLLSIGKTFKINWTLSQLGIPDLNSPECGLSFKPIIYKLIFENKCFKNSNQNKTFYGLDRYPKRKNNPNERMFRGQDIEFGETPFVTHLSPKRKKEALKWSFTGPKWDTKTCTGVLITLEWVLTAAHCLQDWVGSLEAGIDVYAGTTVRRGNDPIKMSRFIAHPIFIDPKLPNTNQTDKQLKYRQRTHDIALIKLKQKFKIVLTQDLTYLINPICLPKRADLNTKHLDMVKFFGYGIINSNIQPPNVLQKGYIKLMENCEHNSFCYDYKNMPNGPKICAGDSGGPLIQYLDKKEARALLIGITSSSIPPFTRNISICGQDIGGQFVAIPYFIDWIIETIQNN